MRLPLERLADASAALSRGEEATEEQAWTSARDALDDADRVLEELRGAYRDLPEEARPRLAALAGPLRQRRDGLAARIPAPRAVSEGSAVHDPDEDEDPAGEAGATGAGPAVS
ncbi:hypothetical protein SK069_18390 [Patulibacter brassicae]|jgi:hypothetical protein|uniref:Uncharacterized protein n=1 Tax=Patulibacter brassicae TaxID=1705717 RepID=A0ABU4VRP8_9ACTN|nr:hypothetical protein [Patulibacter brassicae]MDX8153573.1 hypothetical protein [Patulibacter brassicae]